MPQMGSRAWGPGLLGPALVFLATAARAGIFGVPTNLDNGGVPTASSANPPGWFVLNGPSSAASRGDLVHQIRLFVEVTDTTLEIRIFDPGASGARDESAGTGAATANSTTTFTVFEPSGTPLADVSQGDDSGSTDNQLVRFTPNSGGQLVPLTSNVAEFTGLAPGLHELRIEVTSGNETNAFGVDVRVSRSDARHYNVFTYGQSATPDSAMLVGAMSFGSPAAGVTSPVTFFPYVCRGCSLQTSSFDADGAGPATLTDATGAGTGLAVSGGTSHAETTDVVADTSSTSLTAANYGLWTLTQALSSSANLIDWRVADFAGWSDNPGSAPRNPTSPLRIYIPNDYVITGGNVAATAPVAPVLAVSTVVAGGANPPAVGVPTRFTITASVDHPADGAAAQRSLADVQITIPVVSGATYVTGSQVALVDGVAAPCTDGSAAGYRRCTFASLSPGSTASLQIDVDYTPSAVGVQSLTGAPASGSPPPDTTVWAQVRPAYDSATYPRTEYLGPACNLTIDVGGARLATRATIRGLRVDPAGIVEIATGSQQDVVSLGVYEATGARGTPRRLLARARVRSRAPDSSAPVLYTLHTGPITAPHLMIEEVDGRGRRHVLGPFPVGDPKLRAAFEDAERRAEAVRPGAIRSRFARRIATARASRAPRELAGAPAVGVKIAVGRGGPVVVAWSDLAAHGLPGIPLRRLTLTNRGEAVPFDVTLGPLGEPEALSFVALERTTPTTSDNVYVLSRRRGGPSLQAPISEVPDPPAEGFVRVERQSFYVANAPEDTDPWVWDLLMSDSGPWPYPWDSAAGDFDLPGLPIAKGDVAVRIRLAGRSQHVHTVTARINGTTVGSRTFEGAQAVWLEGTVPASTIEPTGNKLTLAYSAPTPDPNDIGLVYLGHIDLGLSISSSAPGEVVGLAPFAPAVVQALGTDYLIVTHPLFRAQADTLASLKASEGHVPLVVTTDEAYDRATSGIVEPNAIHALIKEVASSNPLAYVLLVGDDTFDPRDFAGTGSESFLPSLLSWDGEFGRIPSENRYADLDGDGSPDVAIGRLPVATVDEAQAAVEKIARQTQALAASLSRHVFAVDNQSPTDISFRDEAMAIAASMPPGSTATFADVGDGISVARQALLAGFAQGAMMTHYFGHGGPEVWADEGLLTRPDVAGLAGQPETLLLTWACEAQWYQYLFGDTINEALFLLPQGGAVAAFGPSGVTDVGLQTGLYRRLYAKLFEKNLTLGEAIRQAKAETLAQNPGIRPVVDGFNLIGDPALRLPETLTRIGRSEWKDQSAPKTPTSRPRSER